MLYINCKTNNIDITTMQNATNEKSMYKRGTIGPKMPKNNILTMDMSTLDLYTFFIYFFSFIVKNNYIVCDHMLLTNIQINCLLKFFKI